jgi:Mg/Co/Ni transporter MgtE
MVNNIVCFGRRTTVGSAIEELKKHSREGDLISIVFVIESPESSVLVGSVQIKALFNEDELRPLEDIMDPFVATLNPFDRAVDAAYRIIGAQVPALPVTDPQGFLLGAVTIDAAIGLVVPGDGLRSLKVFA